jgi:hypothetical protein
MGTEIPDDPQWSRELDAESAFIDEGWLDAIVPFPLHIVFDRPDGSRVPVEYRVVGVGGAGSTNIAFKVDDPDSRPFAIKMTRRSWSFACYIRELLPSASGEGERDLQRLYRKLDRLVGDPMLDGVVTTYRDLYRTLVDNLHAWPPIDELRWESPEVAQFVAFGIRAPGTRSLMRKLAAQPKCRTETVDWVNRTLPLLDRVELDAVFRPESLHENPLYVWGAGMLEGFVNADSEETKRRTRDLLAARPDWIDTFNAQAWALDCLFQMLHIPGTERFQAFCMAAAEGL